MGRKRFAVVLLLALLLVLAPSALATKYLVISESDTNYLNFIARYRAINKSLGYPNTATKTTRFTEHWVKTSPSVSSMMVMSDGVYTAVEPYLTTNEKNAVVSELPSGYSLNTAVTIYNAEFSALTTGMAIINESDSIASSPNGEFALALPDRFYYKLGQLAPAKSEVINIGVGGDKLQTAIDNFNTRLGAINFPSTAQKVIIIYDGGNDATIDGQNGYGVAIRLFYHIQQIHNKWPDCKVYVQTPMARLDNTLTTTLRDYYLQIKAPKNMEEYNYYVIDQGADARGNIMTNYNSVLNRTFWNSDNEHPKPAMTTAMAENAAAVLWPDTSLDPVLKHFGSFWRKPIATATATYTVINQDDGHGDGINTPNHVTHYYGDRNRLVWVSLSDPIRDLYFAAGFGPGRPNGSQKMPFEYNVPDALYIGDADPGNTPNEAGYLYYAPRDTATFMNTMSRPYPDSPEYPGKWPRLWGYINTNHAGAGMNAPPVTKAEMDAQFIPHALAFNFPTGLMYWDTETSSSWIPPATNNDSGANAGNHLGVQPGFRMGTKLAIPADVNPEDFGITDPDVITVWRACQAYGGYVVDSTSIGYGWGWSIAMDVAIETRLDSKQQQMAILVNKLQMVVE